ncbi:MAG: hypothetical protein KJ607_01660 [Bacteroidetes bacterium]|nr:hypothetical protein [Bacteroidota bacterium]
MKYFVIPKYLFLLFFLITTYVSAQRDTANSGMAFDFGITRGRNINVWPLLRIFRSKEERDVQIMFPVYRYHEEYTKGIKHSRLFPLYWIDSTSSITDIRAISLYYPSLIYHTTDRKGGIRSFRFLEIAPEISFLEMTRSADGLFVQNNAFLLLWHEDNKLTGSSYTVVFPVMWSFTTGRYKSLTVFPVYSGGTNIERNNKYFAVTPIYWHFSKAGSRRNVLFPLWWNYREGEGADMQTTDVVFPLYWSKKDAFNTNRVLFPLIWSHKEPEFSRLTVLPLFSAKHSFTTSDRHFMACMLYWHHSNSEGAGNVFFPVWWSRREGDGENAHTTNVVFPVYWAVKDSEKDNKVLFPVVWSLKNPYYRSLTILPLFSSGTTAANERNHLIATPLFWHFRDGQKYSNTLFPVWWNRKEGSGDEERLTNVIFPVYWAKKDMYRDNKVLFPVVWSMKTAGYKSLSLLPFFSSGRSADSIESHLMAGTLFWHFRSNNDLSNTIFPLWWYRRSGEGENADTFNVIYPFYWSYRNRYIDNDIFFPVYWNFKNPDYRSLTLLPFFSAGHSPDGTDRHLMAASVFWHFKDSLGYSYTLFPLWWKKQQGTGALAKYSNVLFPVFWSFKNSENKNTVLFPVWWNLSSPDYRSLTVLPVCSKGNSPDFSRSHQMTGLLYWNIKNNGEERNVLFPLYWSSHNAFEGDTVDSRLFLPLYRSYKSRTEQNNVVFPVLWSYRNPGYRSFTFFPLFSTGKSPDGSRKHLMATPLFWNVTDADKTNRVLFPLWWYERKGSGEDTEYSNVILPLWWASGNRERDMKVFFPLWWHEKRIIETDTSRFSCLFPVYWSRMYNGTGYRALFPLIWQFKDPDYTSLTLMPLFSAGHSTERDRNHLAITPLYWHFKNSGGSRNVLFPLWWSQKHGEGDARALSGVLFPLYWAYNGAGKNNRILFPLFWRLKNEHYSSFTLAPLISAGFSPDRKTRHTVVTPFFWNIQRHGAHRIILLPIAGYYTDTAGVSKMNLLYFLARYRKSPDESSFNFIWPLCEYSKQESRTSFRFVPVVWYNRSPQSGYFSIQPFYYQKREQDTTSYYFLWQLFTYRKYADVRRSGGIFWKAVCWDRYDNGDHEFRMLYLMLASVNRAGNIERGVFPFYHYTRENNGNKSLSLFLSVYHSFSRQIPGSEEFYREEKLFWFLRIRSNFQSLKDRGIVENKKQLR